MIGLFPGIFLAVSIGSGLEKVIHNNLQVPSVVDIISSPDIYIPLSAFFGLILITIILRNLFYKN